MTVTAPVAVFAALGDDTRHRLVHELASHEHASAAALAEPLAVSRQAVEKHLRVLERAGLVQSERTRGRVRYAVRPETLVSSAAWLQDVAHQWELRLVAVKEAAERVERG